VAHVFLQFTIYSLKFYTVYGLHPARKESLKANRAVETKQRERAVNRTKSKTDSCNAKTTNKETFFALKSRKIPFFVEQLLSKNSHSIFVKKREHGIEERENTVGSFPQFG
jgi:hypothetical protein